MDDYISKPVDPLRMFAVLRSRMKGWHGKQQNTLLQKPEAQIIQADAIPQSLPGIDLPDVLKRLNGNFALLKSLLQSFQKLSANTKLELSDAIVAQNAKQGEELAHTMLGTAGNLGATRLSVVSGKLERAFRAHEWEAIEKLSDEYNLAHEEVVHGLQAYFSKNENSKNKVL